VYPFVSNRNFKHSVCAELYFIELKMPANESSPICIGKERICLNWIWKKLNFPESDCCAPEFLGTSFECKGKMVDWKCPILWAVEFPRNFSRLLCIHPEIFSAELCDRRWTSVKSRTHPRIFVFSRNVFKTNKLGNTFRIRISDEVWWKFVYSRDSSGYSQKHFQKQHLVQHFDT